MYCTSGAELRARVRRVVTAYPTRGGPPLGVMVNVESVPSEETRV